MSVTKHFSKLKFDYIDYFVYICNNPNLMKILRIYSKFKFALCDFLSQVFKISIKRFNANSSRLFFFYFFKIQYCFQIDEGLNSQFMPVSNIYGSYHLLSIIFSLLQFTYSL